MNLALRAPERNYRSRRRQHQDIEHHYDLDNDFFRLWLDESMTYSCAYFRSPLDSLEQAQQQKIRHVLKKLRLRHGETLLDIGGGWGALAVYAAERFHADVLAITLSEEQHRTASDIISARGLETQAEMRLAHYAELANTKRHFDKVVSIGMIEHVGRGNFPKFMRSLKSLLRPGGLALLHHITIVKHPLRHSRHQKTFAGTYIFPGGYVPTLHETLEHLNACDFRVLDIENLGPHYVLTLDLWSERFERNASLIRALKGDAFVRMWRLYLRGALANFREGAHEVHQILVSHGKATGLPLTRDDIYS